LRNGFDTKYFTRRPIATINIITDKGPSVV
jgi:hypothetical protein